MKELIMMKGLPGCGKSTKARQIQGEKFSGAYKIINKDLLREMLHANAWSEGLEKDILVARDGLVNTFLVAGKSVIVDDTNLAPKHEARLRDFARRLDAKFTVIDMTDVTPEICIAQDLKRPKSVGAKVIMDTYTRYIADAPLKGPAFVPGLPSCVIFDIDGTVATMNGRGPFEEDKVSSDLPRREVINVIRSVKCDYYFAMSGRSRACYVDTLAWIREHVGHVGALYMRPEGDSRPDNIVKRELYETNVLDKFNVLAVFDDRMSVCRMWRDVGLGDRLFRVGQVDRDDF